MVDRGHKAPTAVSLAPLAEKSPFERMVARYWPVGAGAVVLVVGGVIVRERIAARRADERNVGWDRLAASTTSAGFPRVPTAKVDVLQRVADENRSTPVAPWALLLAAREGLEEGDGAAAERSLQRLQSEYAAHSVNADLWPIGPAGTAQSLSAFLADAAKAEVAWRESNSRLFSNPPLPDGAPSVTFHTSAGDFTISLYPDPSNEVLTELVSRCSEGGFNGTHIYIASPGVSCEFGDPTTRDSDRAKWGTDASPRTFAAAPAGLRHFAGVVSVRPGQAPGTFAADRFRVALEASHELDATYLVIGAVTGGLDVLTTISAREVDSSRPGELKEPIAIDSCEAASSR